MGSPKFQRKKYSTPSHPWQGSRIDEERDLIVNYGLKNKKEIWKANAFLRKFKAQAKRLIRIDTEQARKEEKELLEKLFKLNLLPKNSKLENVLGLTINDILERRLQTQVLKLKLARTMHQARQFITHGHISVNNKKIDVPSYRVLLKDNISFSGKSTLAKEDHPERFVQKPEVKTQLKLPKGKEKPKEDKPKKKEKKVPTAHELAEKKKVLQKLDKLKRKMEKKTKK